MCMYTVFLKSCDSCTMVYAVVQRERVKVYEGMRFVFAAAALIVLACALASADTSEFEYNITIVTPFTISLRVGPVKICTTESSIFGTDSDCDASLSPLNCTEANSPIGALISQHTCQMRLASFGTLTLAICFAGVALLFSLLALCTLSVCVYYTATILFWLAGFSGILAVIFWAQFHRGFANDIHTLAGSTSSDYHEGFALLIVGTVLTFLAGTCAHISRRRARVLVGMNEPLIGSVASAPVYGGVYTNGYAVQAVDNRYPGYQQVPPPVYAPPSYGKY
eukprot:m.242685 g.242685  ORF g.242685 m.242685 type:complete len:280 (+) comp14085_c0_seq1:45-884(+)